MWKRRSAPPYGSLWPGKDFRSLAYTNTSWTVPGSESTARSIHFRTSLVTGETRSTCFERCSVAVQQHQLLPGLAYSTEIILSSFSTPINCIHVVVASDLRPICIQFSPLRCRCVYDVCSILCSAVFSTRCKPRDDDKKTRTKDKNRGVVLDQTQKLSEDEARFPSKRNRLRWQAANHCCHCFDRASYWLQAAANRMLGRSSGNHDWLLAFSPVSIQTQRTQRKRLRLDGNRA